MSLNDEILSFMDLLDLDEDLIDSRLETLMVRSTYSNKHLKNALQLIQYKLMINLQENTECENDRESNFIAKIISDMNEENIDLICKIIEAVLNLNKSTIICKSEHLLQQMLSHIDLPNYTNDCTTVKSMTMLNLKVCDSILDAIIKNGAKLSLMFLEAPLENILSESNEKLKFHFLTNTVPRLFEGTVGYYILDRIWNYIKHMTEKDNVLEILCSLSEFYLPVADEKGNLKFESEIIFNIEFWNLLLFGLQSNNPSVRKISVYLIKRAIDCSISSRKNIHIKSGKETLFIWKHEIGKELKQMWDNFFILIDSLEEKQSNIVLPSLKLFDTLKNMQSCWLKCAFNIALRHDNTQVRTKCIQYRLTFEIFSEKEAIILLEALNDINLYDCYKENEILKQMLVAALKTTQNLYIFKAIPNIKWSPVPMYHLSKVLASINDISVTNAELPQIVIDILKIPCNKIAIRKAIHVNMSHFIGNCCKDLHWKDILNIYSSFNFDTFSKENKDDNPFIAMINGFTLNTEDKEQLFNVITNTHANIDFGLIYLKSHKYDIAVFLNKLGEKIKNIQDNTNRQYADKMECLNDVIYLTQLCRNSVENDFDTIKVIAAREYKTLIQFIFSLLSNETEVGVEEIILLFKGFHIMPFCKEQDQDVKELELQLYKSSIMLLMDNNVELQKKVLSIFIVNNLSKSISSISTCNYKHEIMNIRQSLKVLSQCQFIQVQNKESNGKLRNVFFEKACELIHNTIKQHMTDIKENLRELLEFIDKVTECGGYGCLIWILRTINEVLPELLSNESLKFNMTQFIDRMWKETEELKSNNQYSPCIEQFVNLITNDALLKKPMYNNFINFYGNKIIEYGPMKNAPLFYLIRNISSKDITTDHGQLIYIVSEILLYSPIPRKDQRIAENVEVEILHDPTYGMNNYTNIHFNYQIKHLSVLTLCKICNPEILSTIVSVITTKINDAFRNKQRYHGNSQPHRLLLCGLQHLLTVGLLSVDTVYNDVLLNWVIELMEKLPHQPSVRICMEWYLAVYLCVQKIKLDSNIELLKSSKIPLTSQFVVLYWVLKHKITNNSYGDEEYDFVMDTLLSHTMGQLFNVRLYAQYLATQLYEMKNSEKYSYTIDVIQKTFREGAKDKNFMKLKEDMFVNQFDIINNLTPTFIYYFMPRYFEIGANEFEDNSYIRKVSKEINENISKEICNDLKKEWMTNRISVEDVLSYNFDKNDENGTALESGDATGTIQKKYIPWKNMSDIDVYETGKKRESSSELIVVASLIDKLPNLGGMARTSEVFGVKTYVVDSLRHLQDKQFQGLSVSAERWVDIEEVRPGQPLKEYLTRMKAQGYSVVAAEQTSSSSKLQSFKFPVKTLLLLGHEKEGIPCDLLPFMDHCVEIPQQGFVRSLNVHVTASIFIWEYVRQNLL